MADAFDPDLGALYGFAYQAEFESERLSEQTAADDGGLLVDVVIPIQTAGGFHGVRLYCRG